MRKEHVTEALQIAAEHGHQIRLIRDRSGSFRPLFRWYGSGRCELCGAVLVVNTSPVTIGSSLPWGDRMQMEPHIYGSAASEPCTGENAPPPPDPRRKTRVGKMNRSQYKRHKYYLRLAMSR